MKITPKTVITNRISGECQTGARTNVSVRHHQLLIDEPIERGGTDLGPTPVETMLSALLACTNRITHTVAGRHDVTIDNLEVRLVASFDRRCLEEDMDVPFPEIDILIDMTTDADDDAIEIIKRELPIYCPVSKVFRQSGTRVNEVWTIHRP